MLPQRATPTTLSRQGLFPERCLAQPLFSNNVGAPLRVETYLPSPFCPRRETLGRCKKRDPLIFMGPTPVLGTVSAWRVLARIRNPTCRKILSSQEHPFRVGVFIRRGGFSSCALFSSCTPPLSPGIYPDHG